MTKRLFTIIILISFVFMVPILAFTGDVRVRGYMTKEGTYVTPHHRTSPDGNKFNNWSTRGNVNPHTGKIGTKDPFNHQMDPQPFDNWE